MNEDKSIGVVKKVEWLGYKLFKEDIRLATDEVLKVELSRSKEPEGSSVIIRCDKLLY